MDSPLIVGVLKFISWWQTRKEEKKVVLLGPPTVFKKQKPPFPKVPPKFNVLKTPTQEKSPVASKKTSTPPPASPSLSPPSLPQARMEKSRMAEKSESTKKSMSTQKKPAESAKNVSPKEEVLSPSKNKSSSEKIKLAQRTPLHKPSKLALKKTKAKISLQESPPKPKPKSNLTPPPNIGPRSVREIAVSEALFTALEQAQGRVDERTDAQRVRQEEKGWYGWGILEEYADPDQPVELLGGVLTAKYRYGGFYRLSANPSAVRKVFNVSAAFGTLGIRAHDPEKKAFLERAILAGSLPGRVEDYELWYLFPKREALYIQNKVVKAFECAIAQLGLSGPEADEFRQKARLRFEVVALKRPNGGVIGCLIPRYFLWKDQKMPFPEACLAQDPEWQKLKDLL